MRNKRKNNRRKFKATKVKANLLPVKFDMQATTTVESFLPKRIIVDITEIADFDNISALRYDENTDEFYYIPVPVKKTKWNNWFSYPTTVKPYKPHVFDHKYKFNDGGKAESYFGKYEHSDCAVRSLAISFDLNYDFVYRVCKRYNRVRGDGMYSWDMEKAIKYLCKKTGQTYKRHLFTKTRKSFDGKHWYTIELKTSKLVVTNDWLLENTKGRWILDLDVHYAAVVFGVVQDSNSAWCTDYQQVHIAYEIIN